VGKRGPASSFNPDNCKLAYKFCMLGATNEDLARIFEVAVSIVGNWLREFPDFKEAVNKGRAVADADVAERLFERATGYSCEATRYFQSPDGPQPVKFMKHYAPDTAACIFWLSNRRRDLWREKIEHEHRMSTDMVAVLDVAGQRAINVRRG